MARLGDYIKQIRGVSYKPEDLHSSLDDNSIILLRANNIQDGKLVLDDVVFVDKSKVRAEQLLKQGDILICTSSGSKELVGKAAFVEVDMNVTFGAFCKVVRPIANYPRYIGHFFNSKAYRDTISAISAGVNINNIRGEHIDELLINMPSLDEQRKIAAKLDKVDELISLRKKQLQKLDDLIKSRFVEMFGDPIYNTKRLKTNPLKDVLSLKAGDFTAASDITDVHTETNKYPCYGGNGIRGYVADYNQEGEYSLVGRQGALSGNVQFASGRFKNTEHALLVTPVVTMNSIWLNQLLLILDLKRYQTGAAQPGLSVKNLQEIQIITVSIDEQDRFARFVEQTEKTKAIIQKGYDKLEQMKQAMMQKYFG